MKKKDFTEDEEKKRFEQIVRENTGRIFKMVYNMVEDYELTKDLTQDVFMNAWDSFDKFRGDSSAYTWLYRIALNRVFQHRRKEARKNTTLPLEDVKPQKSGKNPESELLKQADSSLVRNLLEKLPEKFQKVLVLRYFEDLEYAKISETLDIPIGTVRSRLHRGISKLENLLRSKR